MKLVIYEWNAWSRFMLVRMIPEARRLTAVVGETADQVLARLPPKTDAFAFHLNVTFAGEFPCDRSRLVEELVARGIVVLNAESIDISKRAVHARCRACGLPAASAGREGDPTERLIAKTNHNFGGHSERQLTPAQLATAGLFAPSRIIADWTAYRVLLRHEVPDGWWDDPALVLERFVDNRQDHLYRVNFAGDQFVILRLTNPALLKKIGTSTQRLDIYCRRGDLRDGPVPGVEAAVAAAVLQYLDASGMDFGALEVMADDAGRAYVIDVATTCYAAILNVRILSALRRGAFRLIASRARELGRPVTRMGGGTAPTLAMLLGDVKRMINWRNAAQ